MRIRTLWIVHIAAFISVAIAVALDLRFVSILGSGLSVREIVAEIESGRIERWSAGLWSAGLWAAVTVTAIGSFAMLCVSLFRRKRSAGGRSIISLLGITAVVAIWCSIALNHTALAWQGKRMRMSLQVDHLETIAAPLREHWPQRDSELPGIGPFMAYPFGRPSTLILLQSPPVAGQRFAGQRLCVSAVDRSESGAIKLQLGGSPFEDWVEWHPSGSRPRSFVGGLSDGHSLHSSAPLGQGWYLVRYNVARTGPEVHWIARPSPNRTGESAVAI